MSVKFCPHCGAKSPSLSAKFCISCGESLDSFSRKKIEPKKKIIRKTTSEDDFDDDEEEDDDDIEDDCEIPDLEAVRASLKKSNQNAMIDGDFSMGASSFSVGPNGFVPKKFRRQEKI